MISWITIKGWTERRLKWGNLQNTVRITRSVMVGVNHLHLCCQCPGFWTGRGVPELWPAGWGEPADCTSAAEHTRWSRHMMTNARRQLSILPKAVYKNIEKQTQRALHHVSWQHLSSVIMFWDVWGLGEMKHNDLIKYQTAALNLRPHSTSLLIRPALHGS